jgi:hypothetical protein
VVDEHDEADAEAGSSAPVEHEHAEVRSALDGIQAALDDVAATIARMG